MNIKEKYTFEIQKILGDIEILKYGKIYEIDHVPGVPKCSTVGIRLEENFEALLAKIENRLAGDIEIVAKKLR